MVTQDQIIEVGKALLPYLRESISHVDLGHAAFNAVAALNRVQNATAQQNSEEWHMGPKYIGGWPIYKNGKHLATFWGENSAEAEKDAARACALSRKNWNDE